MYKSARRQIEIYFKKDAEIIHSFLFFSIAARSANAL